MGKSKPSSITTAVIANLLIFAVLAYVAFLETYEPDRYYATVQEDEYLEWATFWAFAGAAAVFAMAAWRQFRDSRRLPWFLLGVVLFCSFVAMEEISWGQRVIGYRPPVYFLEHNFQQELNVHNVFSTQLRKLSLKGVIVGYGVALPLLNLIPAVGRLLARIGVVAPPAALIPAFGATYALYEAYPWKYSGETVELMLGLGFLFAALLALSGYRPRGRRRSGVLTQPALVAGAWLVVIALGHANAALARIERSTTSEYTELAKVEVQALRDDFLAMAQQNKGKLVTRCIIHKRVYTYEQKYRKPHLYKGRFARLTEQAMPEERAEFFLDPWNNPYWIHDYCDGDASGPRRVFVYSFGPNRRRDSSHWEIRGDDVGAFIYQRGSPPAGDGS